MANYNLPLHAARNRVLLLLLLIMLLGCNYYKPIQKTTTTNTEKVTALDSLQQRVFIVHNGNAIFWLDSVRVDPASETLSGAVRQVQANHLLYINDAKHKYKYSQKDPSVLQELHLYTSLATPVNFGDVVTITPDNISKFELLERDKQKSTFNTVMLAIGISAGALVLASAIAVALKESCPFVSAYDGSAYQLQGESFGGAIYPSLAREDFIPLPALHVGADSISLLISNELQERQYTDMANLLLVAHTSGERVVVSPQGDIQMITREWQPRTAMLNNNSNQIHAVSTLDNESVRFNDTTATNGVNELVLTFEKPKGESNLNLVLHLRNDYWLEYIHSEFTKGFGKNFNQWRERQKGQPADTLLGWQRSQHLPLIIKVKNGHEWQQVAEVLSIGPLMNRELAIPLSNLNIPAEEVEVSISAGFLFWQIDKAALALGYVATATQVQTLLPARAIDENGKDVLPQLLVADGIYLEQPAVGNRAYIKYIPATSMAAGMVYTAILHTKGYYEPIRNYTGEPDRAFLENFKKAGAFPAFSLARYKQVMQQNMAAKTK